MKPDDCNYTASKTIEEICEVLRRRIEVHKEWVNYLESDSDGVKRAKARTGKAETHRLCIKQYEAAIDLITKQLHPFHDS